MIIEDKCKGFEFTVCVFLDDVLIYHRFDFVVYIACLCRKSEPSMDNLSVVIGNMDKLSVVIGSIWINCL